MAKNLIELELFYKQCIITSDKISTPVLYTKSKTGKTRWWQAHIISATITSYTQGWQENIKLQPINNSPAAYYTTYGAVNGKTTYSAPTVVNEGKNIKQINETTAFQQAALEVRALFNNKINSGAVVELGEISNEIWFDTLKSIRVNVMLLHDYLKNREKVKFPCCMQPKLDGLHLVAVWNNTLDLYSRGMNKKISQSHIRSAIEPVLKDYPGTYLTGEIFKMGLNRQEITSQANKESDEDITIRLEFHVFDLFVIPIHGNQTTIEQSNWGFVKRYKLARRIVKKINSKYILLVEAKKANSEIELDNFYDDCMKLGYEGIVVRNNGKYEYGVTREIRSYNAMKYKKREDKEFKIINYKEGQGKYTGCIIFEAECENNLTFWVEPNWTIEQRRTAYLIGYDYIGKWATISYDSISKDGIPQQPKLIAFV